MWYRSFPQAMRERFGGKVYKLALDGGMTCPNRDGTLGTRGCIFCSEVGAGEFASPACTHVAEQLAHAKQRVAHKNKGGQYIAYFQSFTNTYAPLPYLDALFRQAIASPEIVALSIATRPDCLGPEVLALLQRLNQIKPVWVELGLQTIHPDSARYIQRVPAPDVTGAVWMYGLQSQQTIHPDSARYIRRGYALPVYDHAVCALKRAGLEVITHVILGLPGECREDMVETARYVGRSGADGIKLQLLHVLEGTDLAQEYREGKVPVLTLEEYIQILEDCLSVLPPRMVIHRLTGDGDKRTLLAPSWSANKKLVLHAIQTAFVRDQVQQGSRWTDDS